VIADLRQIVRQRARACCEYCRFPEEHSHLPFHLEHVIARQHGGQTVVENLAWACPHCNAFKEPNLAGWNPENDEIVRLFNPRKDVWDEHFEWSGATVVARTDIGRITVHVLQFNDSLSIRAREELFELEIELS
jgi:hypothetical protein